MKKGNIIDLTHYRDDDPLASSADSAISTELETAIKNLIYRLRELGPLPCLK